MKTQHEPYEAVLIQALDQALKLRGSEPRLLPDELREGLERVSGCFDPEDRAALTYRGTIQAMRIWHYGPMTEPENIDWTGVTYVHSVGMMIYALTDMSEESWLADRPMGSRNEADLLSAEGADVVRAICQGASPRTLVAHAIRCDPDVLISELSTALSWWYRFYGASARETIGQCLVHSHIAHMLRYGLFIQGGFVLAVAWTRSAEWALPWRSLYESTQDSWSMIRDAVMFTHRHGLSPVRGLFEAFSPAPPGFNKLRWVRDLYVFGKTYPLDWWEHAPFPWVSFDEEYAINHSLLRVFG